jgi:hypothetical protein
MTIREVPYPTDTRKFEVRHNRHDYICYIPSAFNCLGASVWEDGEMIEDARLAIQIELACRSAMR